MTTPLAEQTAVYRGQTRADSLQLFAADAQRAREAGYVPVSEDWQDDNGQAILTVGYARAAASPTQPIWASPTNDPHASGVVLKKGHGKLWTAVAAVIVVFVGLAALGAATKPAISPPTANPPNQIVASDAARWAEFGAWVTGDMQSIVSDSTAISDAANSSDVAGTMAVAGRLRATATRLIAYLDGHPAAPCYATVYGNVRRAMEGYVAAGTAASSGDFTTGATEMDQASGLIGTATDNLPAANTACTR